MRAAVGQAAESLRLCQAQSTQRGVTGSGKTQLSANPLPCGSEARGRSQLPSKFPGRLTASDPVQPMPPGPQHPLGSQQTRPHT